MTLPRECARAMIGARSIVPAVYTFDDAQLNTVLASRDNYQTALKEAGFGPVTTEIKALDEFYYAEEYHQQYLAKNPQGYCGLAGTGSQLCLKQEINI